MFKAGTQIGRYEIQRHLGRGGMGTVYAAHDAILGRLVAIKVFEGDLDIPDARERFEREARSAAGLAHPHIVAVHDFGEHELQPYIVMEYVKGDTLAEVIRRKAPVAFVDKLRWVEELAAAAGYAHKMSVIHRDIKPANLIIDRFGRLKVLDFGIARLLGTVSHTTDTIGTPGYMAPEQIQGEPLDGRADVFSIGVVFYELLSYTEAFPGETGLSITHRILNYEPVPLPRLVPDLNPDVLPIVERALKKHAHERFPDAEALATAVNRVRRRFEHDSAAVAPTVLRRDTPAPKGGRPGTGSAKRPVSEAVGLATPPPADREARARRRAAQLEASLTKARAYLGVGDLATAFDACQEALTLDETHAGALALEEKIRTAIADQQAAAVDGEEIQSPDDEVDGSPEPAVAGVEYAPTVLAPPRRTPAPLPPVPPPPVAPRPREAAAPRTPPTPSWLARMRAAAPVVKDRLRAVVPDTTFITDMGSAFRRTMGRLTPAPTSDDAGSTQRSLVLRRLTERKATIAWAGVAVVIAVVAILMVLPVAVSPAGTLVIDAVPWGTITAIEAENGERLPLPSPASTPLALSLPAGTYQVSIAGPTPESDAQRISVTVARDAATVAPTVRFTAVTPEAYFEQYLAVPSVPAEPVVPPVDAAPSAVPVTPAGVSP